MRVHAKKTNLILAGAACVIAVTLSCAVGEEPAASNASNTPKAGAPSSAAAGQAAQSPSVAAGQAAQVPNAGANNTATALDYLFNRKPQDGSVAKQANQVQGHLDDKARAADALGLTAIADPQVRARFERYLGMPEVSPAELRSYAAQVEKVSALLKKEQVFEAWKELRALAAFDKIDAGVSLELANRIEAIWGTDQASNQIRTDNQRLRIDVTRSSWNADQRTQSMRNEQRISQQNASVKGNKQGNNQNNGGAPNGGVPQANTPENSTPNASAQMASGLEGKLLLTQDYLDALEARARIKLNQLKIDKLFDTAKADFAGYINTLYGSHRHQHVILAANFYRVIFKESQYPVDVANQVNASLEIARDVQNAVDVFSYKLNRNELEGATERLEEAFVASEANPVVLGVQRTQKERVADFVSRLNRMASLIEAHDFGPLEALLNETKALVIDFDPTKPLAIVNAVKLESKLRMGKAKLAAQQGDLKLAMEEFQAAAEAWPGNPALQDSAGSFFDSQDVKNQSVVEFDRLVAEQNLRAIFDKQLAFAPAIHGDAKREEALRSALLKIKTAEIAYEKANLMRNAGDVCGAWETIETATADLPNDNKLNMLRAELSGKGAEFVSAINKAKDAEARHELGFSLSCFAVAQHYYPASTIANAGLQRISQQILSNPSAL